MTEKKGPEKLKESQLDDVRGGNDGVVTYQAPGIHASGASHIDDANESVRHHLTSGDLVHRAGDADLRSQPEQPKTDPSVSKFFKGMKWTL
ncbi:MAG: hypothetical protein AAGD13_22125 [Pseudomonadota bacterium]